MSIFSQGRVAAAVMGTLCVVQGAWADTFVQTYELPTVQSTTSSVAGGVESFDTRATGSGGFVSTFGGSTYTGTYSASTQILGADLFGGAGGGGKYAVTFSDTGYSITLDHGASYFGYWLSALDAGNIVQFYNGSSLVGSLGAAAVIASIGSNSAYFGNPNATFAGQNGPQIYAFVNFYDTTGTFDKIVFLENPTIGGYESDNHTVGIYSDITGVPVTPAVPEPGTYAMMLLGLAGIGGVVRRQRRR